MAPDQINRDRFFPYSREAPLAGKSITLVLCPCWGVQMPYLGLAHLSTHLKSLGVDVYVLDLNIDVYRRVSENTRYLWENTYAEKCDKKDWSAHLDNEYTVTGFDN